MSTLYYWVVLEYVNLVLLIKAIGLVVIILERVQPCIVWPHGATLKYDEVLDLKKVLLSI